MDSRKFAEGWAAHHFMSMGWEVSCFVQNYLGDGTIHGKRGTAQETRVVNVRVLMQVECHECRISERGGGEAGLATSYGPNAPSFTNYSKQTMTCGDCSSLLLLIFGMIHKPNSHRHSLYCPLFLHCNVHSHSHSRTSGLVQGLISLCLVLLGISAWAQRCLTRLEVLYAAQRPVQSLQKLTGRQTAYSVTTEVVHVFSAHLSTTASPLQAYLGGAVSTKLLKVTEERDMRSLPLTTDVQIQCDSIEAGLLLAMHKPGEIISKPYFLLLPVNSQNHHFIRLVQLMRSRWLTPISVPL